MIIFDNELTPEEKEEYIKSSSSKSIMIDMSDDEYFADTSMLSNSALSQYVEGGIFQYIKYIKKEHKVSSSGFDFASNCCLT